MLTDEGLARIAAYADGLGAELRLLLNGEARSTGLVEAAHAAGLAVHGWTLRKENAFLPEALRLGSDPAARGCFESLLQAISASGIDGVFTDDPGPAVTFLADEQRRSACVRLPE